ncbi:MAG: protein kinase [Solobacterium sp.]|nr:protein kinase [Solobacterium sp.]
MAQILHDTYEILDFVGKGGMSTVFKARHIRLNTIVAIKSVRKDQTIDLAAEVHILTKLNHPNLVRVYDIFDDDKLIYIVMDYVEGEDLQHIIQREKVIPEETVIEWFRTLADILRYLHSRKPPIIYRDMKPANVILQTDGTLKLVDFGIAREYKAAATGDTTYIGTNGFAAPEQFGLAQTDGRTDIYSLGMTMFYLATGKSPLAPPYGYTPARKLNPELSEELEAILEKCVKDNPEDRYQSAEELLMDLYGGETYQFYTTGTAGFPTGTAGLRPPTAAFPTGTRGLAAGTKGFATGAKGAAAEQAKKDDSPPAGSQKPHTSSTGTYSLPENGTEPPKPNKKKILIGVAAMVAVVLLIGFFTIHIYSDPTCMEPARCKICGKEGAPALGHDFDEATCDHLSTCRRCGITTGVMLAHEFADATCTEPRKCINCGLTEGEPLGHDYKDADCTHPQICKRCGAENGNALGHDWQEATYDEPETCARCGEKRGEVKGLIHPVLSSWSQDSISIGNADVHYKILDEPLTNCRYLTYSVEISDVTGDPYGTFSVYIRKDGKFVRYDSVTLTSDSKTATKTTYFEPAVSFDAVVIVSDANRDWSYSSILVLSEAQVETD